MTEGRKQVLGVHAPAPRPTRFAGALIAAALIGVVGVVAGLTALFA